MHPNALRRYFFRLCRRALDLAAVCIFVYSVWFYITAQPRTLVSVGRPGGAAGKPVRGRYAESDVGKPIAKEMLFSSEEYEDEEEAAQLEREKAGDRLDDQVAGLLAGGGGAAWLEKHETSFGDGFDKFGNPILPSNISTAQKTLNYIGDHLQVTLVVLPAGAYTELRVTMVNTGHETISKGSWYIVMCQAQDGIIYHGSPIAQGRFLMRHLEGNIFILEPYDQFTPLAPSESFSFIIARIHAASDIYSNWYVAGEGLSPRVVASTTGRFSADFSNVESITMPPERRYLYNQKLWRQKLTGINVVPTPADINCPHPQTLHSIGRWSEWVVLYTEDVEFEANLLSKQLGGLSVQKYEQERKFIQVTTGRVEGVSILRRNESYRLFFHPEQESITIIGATATGAFYGVQTLLGIVHQSGRLVTELPEFVITDYPRRPFRSLMVDVSRSFTKKKEILRLIDTMAMYKVNKLHFHLSDDQGWRLEIPGLEELTKVGSRRVHDIDEKTGLHPYLGAGPHGNTHGSGYYSVEDYREILLYAVQRHIEVVPELDLPGHAHAAIRSMEARTLRLTRTGAGEEEAMRFALRDPADTSSYSAVNEYHLTTVNPCMESTFTFLAHVIDQIILMHKDIQPLRSFHIGGDEVPREALVRSPVCQRFREVNPEYRTTQDIKKYFMKRASGMLADRNLTMQVWEDGLAGSEDNKTFHVQPEGIKVQIWKRGERARAYNLAKKGFQVILSEGEYLYLDHHYEDHVEERGFNWATDFVSMRKMFLYQPLAGSQGLNRPTLANLIGMETTLWSETIRDAGDLHMMIFPRLLVFAERAWHTAKFEREENPPRSMLNSAWNKFANVLVQKELHRLEAMDIEYYIPPPGVETVNGKVAVNTALPGLVVQFSSDRGATWRDFSTDVRVPLGRTAFATRSHNGRRSRTVWYNVT